MSYIKELNSFLNEINDDLYAHVSSDHSFSGSIGAHIRHILEFYQQFLVSVETGLIDYDARRRHQLIETNRRFAIDYSENLFRNFNSLIINENDILTYLFNGRFMPTSIGRELCYLSEHTIHHLALIRLIAESKGFKFNDLSNFGIANSTIIYRKAQNN